MDQLPGYDAWKTTDPADAFGEAQCPNGCGSSRDECSCECAACFMAENDCRCHELERIEDCIEHAMHLCGANHHLGKGRLKVCWVAWDHKASAWSLMSPLPPASELGNRAPVLRVTYDGPTPASQRAWVTDEQRAAFNRRHQLLREIEAIHSEVGS